MGLAEFLLIFLVLAFSAPVAFVVFNAGAALIDEAQDGGAMCAPSRRAAITASVPQEQRRRVVSERTLGPPAGWHEPQHVAIVPAPATTPAPAPAPQRTRRAVPVALPIAVPDWPTRQTVEQPEVVPVVVNRMAARFGSLEIGGK